jgi:hypothetical protein
MSALPGLLMMTGKGGVFEDFTIYAEVSGLL